MAQSGGRLSSVRRWSARKPTAGKVARPTEGPGLCHKLRALHSCLALSGGQPFPPHVIASDYLDHQHQARQRHENFCRIAINSTCMGSDAEDRRPGSTKDIARVLKAYDFAAILIDVHPTPA